jgi:hypothetical protein
MGECCGSLLQSGSSKPGERIALSVIKRLLTPRGRGAAATVVERDGQITGYATEIGFFAHSVARATRT